MVIILFFISILQSFHFLYTDSQTIDASYIPSTQTPPSQRIFPVLSYSISLNCLIVFSGYSSSGEQNDLWTFNLTSLIWAMQRSLSQAVPDPRSGSGGFVSKFTSEFYIYGGLTSEGLVNDVWKYNLDSSQWTMLETVGAPSARQMYAYTTYDDGMNEYFIVFGGKKNFGTGFKVYVLNISSLTWSSPANLENSPPPSFAGNIVVYNKSLYLTPGKPSFQSPAIPMLFKLDFINQTWKNITSTVMYTPRSYAQSALIGSNLYIFYGINEVSSVVAKDVYKVDLNSTTYKWEKTNIVEQDAFSNFGLVAVNNIVYYFGGSGNEANSYSNSLKQVNTDLSKVSYLSFKYNSPPGRRFHSMHLISGQFYLFGGTDGINYFNDIWSFDPSIELWTPVSAIGVIPTGRYSHAAAAQGDAFIIWGGETALGLVNDMHQFNTLTSTWSEILPSGVIPNPAKGACMVLTVPSIYIYGGITNAGFSNEFWEYSLSDNSFKMVSSNIYVAYSACSYYNSEFYVVFGGTPNSAPQPLINKYNFDNNMWISVFSTPNDGFASIQGIHLFLYGAVLKIGGQTWDTYLDYNVYVFNYNNVDVQLLKYIEDTTYQSAYVYYNYSVYVFGGGETLGDNILLAYSHNRMFKFSIADIANGTDFDVLCSEGMTSLGDTCNLCPAGTYKSNINNNTCSECPAGTYNRLPGGSSARQCYPCDEGSYNYLKGQSYCFDCLAGYVCPTGSIAPIESMSLIEVYSTQPKIYSPVSPDSMILNFEISIALIFGGVLIIVVTIARTRELLRFADLYSLLHNTVLNNPMIMKQTRFGGFLSVSFFIIAAIIIGSGVITYTDSNIDEIKTLIPKVVLDSSVESFISERFFIEIELLRYGDACDSNLLSVNLSNFKYNSVSWTSNLTDTRSCIVQLECLGCVLSLGASLTFVSSEKTCYASGINVNVTSSSSIPNENSSILTILLPDYNYIFIGSDPSEFSLIVIPSLFESETSQWPSSATGYHIASQNVPTAGSQFTSLELVTATLLKVNILLDVSLSGLYTRRYLRNTLIFIFASLIGSIFGIMGAIGGVMRMIEKYTRIACLHIGEKKNLGNMVRKRDEFNKLFDNEEDVVYKPTEGNVITSYQDFKQKLSI